MTPSLRILALLLGIGLPTTLSAQSYDQVVPVRGTPTNGKVAKMSPTEVVVDVRGNQQRIPVNTIKRISFAEDPPELRRARDQMLSGQIASGLANLQKIDPASIQRAEIRADLQFYLAYGAGRLALTEGGDKASAEAAMLAFARSNSSSYHFFEAAQLLGDLAAALEGYDQALKYYGAITSNAPWPDYKMQAAISEARILVAQGKPAEAQAKFEQVLEFNVDTPEAMRQKRLAEIGRAASMAEAGNSQQAQQLLEEFIAKNDAQDVELFGRAYNALGKAYLMADQPKKALLAYLHTDILFHTVPEVHAEALYHLSKLWVTAKKSDRASSARSLLTDRYAGSKWAKLE